MNRKRGKRAQFYIIAAVIIVVVIIGLVGVRNYIRVREEPQEFYDLSEVLSREGTAVVDYGIYNQEDLNVQLQGFTELFVDYVEKNKQDVFDLIIVFVSFLLWSEIVDEFVGFNFSNSMVVVWKSTKWL